MSYTYRDLLSDIGFELVVERHKGRIEGAKIVGESMGVVVTIERIGSEADLEVAAECFLKGLDHGKAKLGEDWTQRALCAEAKILAYEKAFYAKKSAESDVQGAHLSIMVLAENLREAAEKARRGS